MAASNSRFGMLEDGRTSRRLIAPFFLTVLLPKFLQSTGPPFIFSYPPELLRGGFPSRCPQVCDEPRFSLRLISVAGFMAGNSFARGMFHKC